MTASPSLHPQRIAIIGGGRLGTYMAAFLPQAPGFRFVGYFDDTLPAATPHRLGALADIPARYAAGQFDALLLGVGYHHMAARQTIFERFIATVPFATYIHPTAWVDPSARLAPGCFVAPRCIIDQETVLEPNVMLNLGVIVAHNARVGAHSFLAGDTLLAGFVEIGERCFLGVRTTTVDKIRLGADVHSGAATTFITDAPTAGLYVGTPARLLRNASEA